MTAGIAGQLSLYDALGTPVPDPTPSPDPVPPVAPVEPVAQGEPPGAASLDAEPVAAVAAEPSPVDDLTLPPLEVEVTRSRRRKKTAEARLVGSVLSIRIPGSSSVDEEQYFVDHFRAKFERSRSAAVLDLEDRASTLAARYGLPLPRSIRWVSNQQSQWGSCTPADGSIRLSDRMAEFPRWVIDYVIVHELAHLVEADHGRGFWALVNQYPKTERARGYLIAKDGV